MKLFIPPIASRLTLERDWTFALHSEYRNFDLLRALFPDESETPGWMHEKRISEVTLPAGTVLSVSRIFIRNGAKDFDSLTFNVVGGPDKRLLTKSRGGTSPNAIRFWAKLADVNEIEYVTP